MLINKIDNLDSLDTNEFFEQFRQFKKLELKHRAIHAYETNDNDLLIYCIELAGAKNVIDIINKYKIGQ